MIAGDYAQARAIAFRSWRLGHDSVVGAYADHYPNQQGKLLEMHEARQSLRVLGELGSSMALGVLPPEPAREIDPNAGQGVGGFRTIEGASTIQGGIETSSLTDTINAIATHEPNTGDSEE